jgi:hypothetical protein
MKLFAAGTRRATALASGPPAPSRGRAFPRPRALRGTLKSPPCHVPLLPSPVGHATWTASPLPAALPAPRTACSPRSRTRPPLHSSLRHQEGRTPAIKGAPQGVSARPLLCGRAAPLAPLKAAAASPGFRPPAHPTETPSTSHCTYCSPPTASSHRHATHLTGEVTPAAGTGWRRGTPLSGTRLPPTPVQIGS